MKVLHKSLLSVLLAEFQKAAKIQIISTLYECLVKHCTYRTAFSTLFVFTPWDAAVCQPKDPQHSRQRTPYFVPLTFLSIFRIRSRESAHSPQARPVPYYSTKNVTFQTLEHSESPFNVPFSKLQKIFVQPAVEGETLQSTPFQKLSFHTNSTSRSSRAPLSVQMARNKWCSTPRRMS